MIDLVAGEDDQPPDHAPWSPAQAERDSEGRSFIPAELSLDRPHIVQSRLDLDDKQAPARRIEREKVDPSMRAALDDLDLARGLPADALQPTLDERGTSSVDEITLATIPDDRRDTGRDVDLDVECDCDPFDKVECRVGLCCLDLRDVTARHADCVGKVLLGQAKSCSSLTAETREGHPDRHRLSEAGVPSP
jgi:hypothetical protein